MAGIIRDDIDFSQYLRDTDPQLKVRSASTFLEDVVDALEPPGRTKRKPAMLLAKLRDVLEFRPGEVTVWAGYNGHRKSLFTGQVALDLCVQHQRVLMASFEMQPARTLARMVRQCTGVARPSFNAVDDFARWSDGRLWMFDHLGRISIDQCMAVCRYFAEELKGQHVVLDSMMMVCASEEHLDEQKQFMTDVVRFAQETGLHVHLVAHCRKPQSDGESRPPTKYDLRGSAAISDQAHNVVTVWANKAKKAGKDCEMHDDPDALVTVEKQRNGSYEGRVKLWFDEHSLRFCDDGQAPVEPYAIGGAL